MNPYPGQNPYAAPQAQVMPAGYAPGYAPARIEGNLLVVANGSTFPPVCLKCGNNQAIEWRDQKYTYIPPWARMFGWLIQMLVAKRSRFQIPVCQPCNKEWKKWTLITALSWLPGMLLIVLGVILASADVGEVGGPVAFLGFAVLFVGLFVAIFLRNKRMVFATKIDKTHSWLRGIHQGAMQAVTMGGAQQGGYPQQMAAPQQAYGAPQQQQAYGTPQGYPQPGYNQGGGGYNQGGGGYNQGGGGYGYPKS
jgi:hypothetical protein